MADAKDAVPGADCEVVVGLPKPAASIADATLAEGNSGTTTMSFQVSLSFPAKQTASVAWATSNGTATSGSDYQDTSGKLVFKPGEQTKTITVAVIGEAAVEPDETFTVSLSEPENATIAKASATGTIQNDDHAVALPGHYEGKDSQNELIAFDVNPDGLGLTNLHTGQTNETCNGGVSLYGGYINYGPTVFPITADGMFSVNSAGNGSVSGFPSKYTIAINGKFSGPGASGTMVVTTTFSIGATNYSCTSGTMTRSATRTG